MIYRWAHDQSRVEFRSQIDGHWWTLSSGALDLADGAFYGQSGEIVARIVLGPGPRPTLITTVDGLDRALADLRRPKGEPVAIPANHDDEPKLCPAPTPEPKTTKSKNAITYQEYVSGLPYGLAIVVGGVRYDACDQWTGDLGEAKAEMDFRFDNNDDLYYWANPKKDPAEQMISQSDAARKAGRLVVWHAQTEKTYRGLKKIADRLNLGNLSVVYDPN